MKTQKIGMALAAALAVASQAQAEGWGHHKAVESGRIEELEEQLQSLKQELADLKAHQQAHHQEMAELKGAQEQFAPVHKGHDSLLFFRGGYARLMSDRAKDILPSPGTSNAKGQNGFYIGAGFEHTLSHDLFGLTEGTPLEGTDLLGEVMFEYKRFAQGKGLLTDSDNGGVVVHVRGKARDFHRHRVYDHRSAQNQALARERNQALDHSGRLCCPHHQPAVRRGNGVQSRDDVRRGGGSQSMGEPLCRPGLSLSRDPRQ
jgi:hypothetical protein